MVMLGLGMVLAGIGVRLLDRGWFGAVRGRRRLETISAVLSLQRRRANDVTPALLLAGHWIEIVGWWFVAAGSPPPVWLWVAGAVAVKFRHLHEVSHFAVHGVLARRRRWGVVLAEAAVHGPLALGSVAARRDRHVRRHHPNATVTGVDPNLDELRSAGLRPGIGLVPALRAVFFPLTPRGVAVTVRQLTDRLRPWWRLVLFLGAVGAAGLVGLPALVFGYVLPRVLLYPELTWWSLLAEHRWFDPAGDGEAGRCLRLYRSNPPLALWARLTWLPYGDLFHYAHSEHPSIRWNYLPDVERIVGHPAFTPRGRLLGRSTVIGALRSPSPHRPSTHSLTTDSSHFPAASIGPTTLS